MMGSLTSVRNTPPFGHPGNATTAEETVFTLPAGFPNDNVWAIEPGLNGEVWIGTESGLAQFKDGIIDKLGDQIGIPAETAVSLLRDTKDTLWIGGGMGLYRLQGTNAVSVLPPGGITIDDFWCNAHTTGDIVWIGTGRNGLIGFDGDAITTIDKRDGLLGNNITSVQSDKDDSLLLGFAEGGISRYQRTKTPPSIRFIEVKINDQTLSESSSLPSTEIGRRVDAQYQEIDLKTHPEKRQFRYRVEGPSREVLFAGLTRDRQFDWTPHKGGDYTFEVQAIDRDLNYSKPARLTFHATVPWYANAWITVPGGGTFAGLMIWAFVARAIYQRQRRESPRSHAPSRTPGAHFIRGKDSTVEKSQGRVGQRQELVPCKHESRDSHPAECHFGLRADSSAKTRPA